MIITRIALLAGTIALAACSQTSGTASASTFYACDGNTRLKVDMAEGDTPESDRVVVQMNDDQPVSLPATPSASGAKYMSATHQFWSKGEEAMWTVGRMAPMTCKQVMMPRGM